MSNTQLFLSRATRSIADLWLQTQFSRHTVQDRLCGVKIVDTARISTWIAATDSMIIGTPVMTSVECLRPLRGADHTCLGGMMTGARMVMSGELQSTQERLGLMRDRFSYKDWSIGVGHTEKDKTGTV